MSLLRAFFNGWTWRMAWRDTRASRAKLLLFSSSIVIGIAALVAISSFGQNLRATIETQAKSLLGADLALTSRDPFTPEMEDLFRKIGGEQSREVIFSSMVFFPKSGGTRMVQVRALGQGFPYYGEFETEPSSAFGSFHQEDGALVEQTLLMQFNSKAGDPVKVGQLELPIAGSILKIPGENAMFSTIAPRVYIPLKLLEQTALLREESLARYKVFFKFPPSKDVEALVRRYRPEFEKLNLNPDTVEERKADLGNALNNVNQFLNLGGFIALLLGAIGIASAIHVHIRQKTGSVAVLRCLGCSVGQTFAIYLLQAIVLGMIGAIVGAALGIALQFTLPRVAADFLPFQLTVFVAWGAVLRAMGAGFAVSLVFALLPLVSIRRISPLAVLRNVYEKHKGLDAVQIGLVVAMLVGVLLLALSSTTRVRYALGFTGGIAVAFGVLALAAILVRAMARKIVSPGWPYPWRQGFANLYRPQNRTLLLLLSLGLGAFLVLTLYRVNQLLSGGLFPKNQEEQPNAALFDIQADQVAGLTNLLLGQKLPVIADVPLVTMRIASIKGEDVKTLLRDHSRRSPRWVLRREYRSTYRDTLDDSERLLKGEWPAKKTDTIPVSVEEGIARDLDLSLGDKIVFDIQGILLTNHVAAIRHVDWKRMQPNFFMVFPTGVLEEAPGFHIITTRTPSREASAEMQRAVVQKFPNVSVIDLALVLDTIDAILSKVSFVVRFMASFTVATGLLVLVASVLTGRYQRMQESILLRTLGASRWQVQKILLVEYFFLGLLSAVTGVLLAEGAAWALSQYFFKIKFEGAAAPALITIAAVTLLTITTGLLANRGVLKRSPLEILRAAG
ncbi:MAG: ABC transporter permease [Verrucomicrobiota bacterium]